MAYLLWRLKAVLCERRATENRIQVIFISLGRMRLHGSTREGLCHAESCSSRLLLASSVDSIPTRVIWEEETLAEEVPLSDWPVGISVDHFLD